MKKFHQWYKDNFVLPSDIKMSLNNDTLRNISFICPLFIVFGIEWICSTVKTYPPSSKEFLIYTIYYSIFILFSFANLFFALYEKKHDNHTYNKRQRPTYFMFISYGILCIADIFITENSIFSPFIFYCGFQIVAILLLNVNPITCSITNLVIFAFVIYKLSFTESVLTIKNIFLFGIVMCFVAFFKRYLAVKDLNQKINLQNALNEAESANKAKTNFLSSMSHDIRTPMNAVMGFTDLIEDHIDDKQATLNYLDKIKTSSEHLLSLINDILDMNRIESGKVMIENRSNRLSDIIDELSSIVESQADSKNIRFFVERKNLHHDFIKCDELHLTQILLNILGNSLKYTDNCGEICLEVEEHPSSDDSKVNLTFTVLDNGIGMSKEIQKHIFEPYTRDNTYTVEKIQGHGLGMNITKNLVDLMGGKITMYSRLHVGTRISVSFSFEKAEEKDCQKHSSSSKSKNSKLFGKRILLVEDNELNREIATSILQETGAIVEMAENGQIAVDKVMQNESAYYDLILMDVQMPVLNGYEATKIIRNLNDANKSTIPIIAMTANAFDEDRKNADESGMSGYVSKPFNTKSLLKLINEEIV